MAQSIFGRDIVKTTSHIIRRDQLTEIVTADESVKLFVKGFTGEFSEIVLKRFLLQKHSLDDAV